MKKSKTSIIICLITLTLTSLSAFGQAKIDPRLKAAMIKTGLKRNGY